MRFLLVIVIALLLGCGAAETKNSPIDFVQATLTPTLFATPEPTSTPIPSPTATLIPTWTPIPTATHSSYRFTPLIDIAEIEEILTSFGYTYEHIDFAGYKIMFNHDLSDIYVSYNQDKLVAGVTIDITPDLSFTEVLAISTVMVSIEPELSDSKWIWEGLAQTKDRAYSFLLPYPKIERIYDDVRVTAKWMGADISIELRSRIK